MSLSVTGIIALQAATTIVMAIVIAISIFLLTFFLIKVIRSYTRGIEEDQRLLSDKDLLMLFASQPDGMLTKHSIAEKTPLSKGQAARRLQHLQINGLLLYGYTNSLSYYYSLVDPLDLREPPELSDEPFLTVEDILKLFKHYDYKLTLQHICLATGLPIRVIKREMKYFEKQKIITRINHIDATGTITRRTYILREPYRSNPDQFLEMESLINPELEKIYEKLMV